MHTRPRNVPIQSPAAGSDWTFEPSNTDFAVVMAVTGILTTSATVANRLPAIQLKDKNGLVYCQADAGRAQTASTTVQYTWARSFGTGISAAPVTGQSVSCPLPDAWLQEEDTIGTVTNGLDGADQWSNLVIRYYIGAHWYKLQREIREATEIQQAIAALGS